MKTRSGPNKSKTKVIDDATLREVSKNWTPEEWETYLVEHVEKSASYQREDFMAPHKYDFKMETMLESIWEGRNFPDSTDLRERVRRAMITKLTDRQKKIIEMLFWEGATEAEVADSLGISRVSVATQRRRSLVKIRKTIANLSSKRRIDEGTQRLKLTDEEQRSSDIKEVYAAEISRFPMGVL